MSRRRPRHSTVPADRPPRRAPTPPLPKRTPPAGPAPRKAVARIIDDSDSSLLDVIDNLLNRGVVLNADVILALANVDLVYLRLSALLCAADRLLPRGRSS
ncbi:MAG TPA: gas vesicle protein [Vicinamibacterales bacterium]|nr:gas vesicle protein [Vicinamibacterales bacterium]